VAVLDVDLIGSMTGFQASRRIKELFPSTQIIIMSGVRDSDRAQLDSIEAGAWGFLAKTQIMTKFVAFVREAAVEGRRG
jgi:DNA-binding NarL/FixJ family response regulator